MMTTTQRISKEVNEDAILAKMKRGSYADWKRNEEAAKMRAEEYRRRRNGR